MAKGIPYFPIEIGWLDDTAVETLVDELGPEGLGVWIILLTAIYANGYYLPWGEENAARFARKNLLDLIVLNKTVEVCTRLELFSSHHFEAHQELTSHAIVTRYLRVRKLSADGRIEDRFKALSENLGKSRNFSENLGDNQPNQLNQLNQLNQPNRAKSPVDNLHSTCRTWVKQADIKKPSSSYIECAHQLVDAINAYTPPGRSVDVDALRKWLRAQQGMKNWKYLVHTKLPNEIEVILLPKEKK